MKIILTVLFCLCVLVGCGESKKEKAAPEAKKPEAVPVVTVTIDNPIVEKAVRKQLRKPTGELTEADLEKVTRLDIEGNQLTDVPKDLEKLTQLEKLNLRSTKLNSLKGLEKLTQLQELALGENQLKAVTALETLTKLETLRLHNNQLTDVKGLENLTQLKYLDFADNKLTDVKGLENLTQLKSLKLFDNPDLTKAQIDELQKALPNCKIYSDPTK